MFILFHLPIQGKVTNSYSLVVLTKLFVCSVKKDLQTVAVRLKRNFVSCVQNLVRPINQNRNTMSNGNAPKSNQMTHASAKCLENQSKLPKLGSCFVPPLK